MDTQSKRMFSSMALNTKSGKTIITKPGYSQKYFLSKQKSLGITAVSSESQILRELPLGPLFLITFLIAIRLRLPQAFIILQPTKKMLFSLLNHGGLWVEQLHRVLKSIWMLCMTMNSPDSNDVKN